LRSRWINHETDGGVAVCVGILRGYSLVHNVQLGTEKAAVNGVLGTGVDVELQSLVDSVNTRDLECVWSAGAIRGVCNLGTGVGEAKGEVGYEARSSLRSCQVARMKQRVSFVSVSFVFVSVLVFVCVSCCQLLSVL
jgi:hypothetical protein